MHAAAQRVVGDEPRGRGRANRAVHGAVGAVVGHPSQTRGRVRSPRPGTVKQRSVASSGCRPRHASDGGGARHPLVDELELERRAHRVGLQRRRAVTASRSSTSRSTRWVRWRSRPRLAATSARAGNARRAPSDRPSPAAPGLDSPPRTGGHRGRRSRSHRGRRPARGPRPRTRFGHGRRSAAPNHDAAPWWASCNRCRPTTTHAAPTTICAREGQQCFDEPETGAELTQ